MSKPYSYDFRTKVIEAVELKKRPKSEVARQFDISRNTMDLWLKRKAETGDYKAASTSHVGPNQRITDWATFRQFAQEHADKTQEQMAELWPQNISQRTISRALKRIGFTRKKTFGYQERDEQKRNKFLNEIAEIDPKNIVYLDESGMDKRDEYAYAWAPKGQRFHAFKSGKRERRINMIAALVNQTLIAPFTLDGAFNRDAFELWLEQFLVPVLKEGQVIVMDNATFHKGGRIRQLIEQAGCRLLYLPPYSPDFNPIEKTWSALKSRIRHVLNQFACLRDAIEYVLNLES